MLERFKGRTGESALSKNQIELTCPLCGSVQKEPRLVLTTLCRNCGDHLRIEKSGLVVASARVAPMPSSVYPAMPEAGRTIEEMASDAVISERTLKVLAVPVAPRNSPGLQNHESTTPHAENRPKIQSGSHPVPQTGLHRMREQGGARHHYFKEVECFDCGNKFQVGRAARSANCTVCGGHICLDDINIDSNSTSRIRTRGDVIIQKTGKIEAAAVRCRDLKIYGALSASIECAGELLVQTTGTIAGEVGCRRLLIDTGCDIHFTSSVFAEEVEVRGRILGHIQCSGSVCITSTGLIQGDVNARAVSIDPGGQLDGAMNIVRVTAGRSLVPPSATV